ncbi:MAG: IgGFc-binding protein [Nannocystis sp.]|nr:IgGFc-binding protein [Nannocystis sp.]
MQMTGPGTSDESGDEPPGPTTGVQSTGPGTSDESGDEPPEPTACEAAAADASHVGCDYWPTILASEYGLGDPPSPFNYVVVVANAGTEPADITVTGPGGVDQGTTVEPGSLTKMYLPWVVALSQSLGGDCGVPLCSVKVARGAYHLVSTRPVSVYQFNPLEYQGLGAPPGEFWLSQSSDASVILPSTAMTGNYRVAGQTGQSLGSYLAITGTQDDTSVNVTVGSAGAINAGLGIVATPAGELLTLSLDAGDVVQLFAANGDDLSGSLVEADKPVQVMTGSPCLQAPTGQAFCDHIEASIVPVEALGKHYFVAVPTGPEGAPIGHFVRLYGHVDGTQLTYAPAAPAGAPATLDAGEVVDLGVVPGDFEVKGNQGFLVGTLMLAASMVPTGQGDPSQSFAVAVERFRETHVFLSPADWEASFVDVVAPEGALLELDGSPVSDTPTPIGATGVVVYRLPLTGDAHRLTSTDPVGIQVMGYGNASGYQYPGGGN